jgi:hypothetical protein
MKTPEMILAEKLEARVDWMSATSADAKEISAWYDAFCSYRRIFLSGYPGEEVSFHGYDGISLPGFKWMSHEHWGAMIVLSGDTARDMWLGLVPDVGRVTRLDLAVTFELVEPVVGFASDWYHYAVREGANGQIKRTLVQNNLRGETYYVGSRKSRYFGRIYDKGVEAHRGEPGRFWRFEVEIKKPASTVAAKEVYARVEAGELLDGLIVNYVTNWFAARDVQCFERLELNVLDFTTTEFRISEAERTLQWFRSQVRPSIRRLIEMGLGEEARNALGLTDRQSEVVRNIWELEGEGDGFTADATGSGVVAADDSREI